MMVMVDTEEEPEAMVDTKTWSSSGSIIRLWTKN